MRQINDVGEVQDILFESLCYFKSICDKYGLRYFLTNGTLLGARKYGEFIPWDDDADIFMPREDYDKLMTIENTDDENHRLLSTEKVPGFRYPYAKLIDTRTHLEECGADFGAEIGVFLDIFPIDKWSPNIKKARYQGRYCEFLKRMLISANQEEFITIRHGIKRFILYLIWKAGHIAGHKQIKEKIIKQALRYNNENSNNCGCVVWAARGKNEILPVSTFEDSFEVKLRGVDFAAPIGCDDYLASLYGDWKSEPPEEDRHSNHDFKIWWKS